MHDPLSAEFPDNRLLNPLVAPALRNSDDVQRAVHEIQRMVMAVKSLSITALRDWCC